MPFHIGVTGLNAAATDLKVTGNNIANVATTGFKQSRAEFGDLFASNFANVSRTATGQGARVMSVTQLFSQGSLEMTQNGLDLAISGQGFFVLQDPDGTQVYSRAGEYQVDRNGFVVNNNGQRLQGFAPLDPRDPNTAFDLAIARDIQLPAAASPASASTQINAAVNLPSDVEPPAEDIEWGDDANPNYPTPDMYNFATSITLYDSLGTARPATIYFRQSDADPLQWDVHVGMINEDGFMEEVGTGQITFDATGGFDPDDLPDPIEIAFQPGNRAENLEVELQLGGSTQYGARFSVNQLTQDGYPNGELVGINVDDEGRLFARYSNNRNEPVAQVALANFTNPQGLTQLGSNNWAASFESGQPTIGQARTGGLGSIQSGALESSNVDLAEQLINLITGQRNYQANAKTIQTADAITQTLINMR